MTTDKPAGWDDRQSIAIALAAQCVAIRRTAAKLAQEIRRLEGADPADLDDADVMAARHFIEDVVHTADRAARELQRGYAFDLDTGAGMGER